MSSIGTDSPAQSFALNGNYAYTCDYSEITAIDITNPGCLRKIATATSPSVQNTGDINCDIQRNTLVAFADQSSTAADNPSFVAFNIANPAQPVAMPGTLLDKRFFEHPVYIGNVAFVPTATVGFVFTAWDNQYGDLLAVDTSNFLAPALVGTLEQPQIHAEYGGPHPVFGVTQASGNLLYIGGTTSTGSQNNGVGRLQVVDVTIPQAMKVVGQITVPGSVHFGAPLLQGTVAVGVGNNGGYVGAQGANPITKGSIVVTTFDISDPRQPSILSTTTTPYQVGPGGGATRIGNYQFAFAGVVDANNNNVLLTVDASNPVAPVIQSIAIPTPFTSMSAVGTTLYATLGASGFGTYSIPAVGSAPPSACSTAVDAMLVVDRGANIPAQAFSAAQTALEGFVGDLRAPSDQVGVVSFTTSAVVNQTLTTSASAANAAITAIIPGGQSYIGGGISAAQAELASPRHNPTATPVIIVLSDGADAAAPTPSSTVAAANAAKAAGIQIISVQYGTGTTTLMQSIASSTSAFYQIPR